MMPKISNSKQFDRSKLVLAQEIISRGRLIAAFADKNETSSKTLFAETLTELREEFIELLYYEGYLKQKGSTVTLSTQPRSHQQKAILMGDATHINAVENPQQRSPKKKQSAARAFTKNLFFSATCLTSIGLFLSCVIKFLIKT